MIVTTERARYEWSVSPHLVWAVVQPKCPASRAIAKMRQAGRSVALVSMSVALR